MFAGGEMRTVLMSLLAERPGHGYDLMTRLGERTGGAYKPSAGAIYPTLQQLADEGVVSSAADGGRNVFSLTAAGRREAASNAAEVEAIWRRVGEAGEWRELAHPDASEVIKPALRLAKAAIKAAVKSHGDPAVIGAVRDVLEEARLRIERVARRRNTCP